jgi:hypothetical protein
MGGAAVDQAGIDNAINQGRELIQRHFAAYLGVKMP